MGHIVPQFRIPIAVCGPYSKRVGEPGTRLYIDQEGPNYGMSMDDYVPAEMMVLVCIVEDPEDRQRLLGSSMDLPLSCPVENWVTWLAGSRDNARQSQSFHPWRLRLSFVVTVYIRERRGSTVRALPNTGAAKPGGYTP